MLTDIDAFLNELLESFPRNANWTVMHRMTPAAKQVHAELQRARDCSASKPKKQQYEMEEPMSSLHTDLKRDLSAYPRAANSTGANLPLFETYQFLNSGRLLLRSRV